MKKLLCLLIAVIMILFVAGCGVGNTEKAEEKSDKNGEEQKISYDLDLTKLSSTMVYSEVFNMMNSPDSYMGKYIKMKGAFSVYHDEASDKNYFACIIADATACCSQGIEFRLKDSGTYPDDYPEIGSEITVSGTFNTYSEGDYLYCELKDAVLEG